MSPRSSKKKAKAGPKPAADVYVGLLFVSLGALLTGLIFLVLELQEYGYQLGG